MLINLTLDAGTGKELTALGKILTKSSPVTVDCGDNSVSFCGLGSGGLVAKTTVGAQCERATGPVVVPREVFSLVVSLIGTETTIDIGDEIRVETANDYQIFSSTETEPTTLSALEVVDTVEAERFESILDSLVAKDSPLGVLYNSQIALNTDTFVIGVSFSEDKELPTPLALPTKLLETAKKLGAQHYLIYCNQTHIGLGSANTQLVTPKLETSLEDIQKYLGALPEMVNNSKQESVTLDRKLLQTELSRLQMGSTQVPVLLAVKDSKLLLESETGARTMPIIESETVWTSPVSLYVHSLARIMGKAKGATVTLWRSDDTKLLVLESQTQTLATTTEI